MKGVPPLILPSDRCKLANIGRDETDSGGAAEKERSDDRSKKRSDSTLTDSGARAAFRDPASGRILPHILIAEPSATAATLLSGIDPDLIPHLAARIVYIAQQTTISSKLALVFVNAYLTVDTTLLICNFGSPLLFVQHVKHYSTTCRFVLAA
jgi:hypothetical protein